MILTIFDLETTGLDRNKDQIIQFAGIKINTDNHQIIDTYNQYIRPVGNYVITLGAYFKHKITPKMLEDKPYFKDIAPNIINFFEGCENILTYNGTGFDLSFLKTELNKYGFDIDFNSKNCYDAFLEEKRRNGISLGNTYKRYKGISMEDAGLTSHDALSDIKATYSIFIAQQKEKPYNPENMYGEDGVIQDMEFMNEEQPCFNVGKYKGISVKYISEMDQGYLKWCLSDKCNFVNNTKKYIKQYIKE